MINKSVLLCCYLGNISVNGHSLEVRENENGTVILRHVYNLWHSGKYKLFNNLEDYKKFTGTVDAKRISDILGLLGVEGFPCI